MATLFSQSFRCFVFEPNLNEWLSILVMFAIVNAESTLTFLKLDRHRLAPSAR
jgi:hypothetical protein